jgi:hypothetical protein
MCAMAADQTEAALLVAKENEILSQHPHRNHGSWTSEFIGQRGWLPGATQNFSYRSTWRAVREPLIFLRTRHSSHLMIFYLQRRRSGPIFAKVRCTNVGFRSYYTRWYPSEDCKGRPPPMRAWT